MCLIKEPKIYNEILECYGFLPAPGKIFIKNNFENIIKTIAKNEAIPHDILTQLYTKMRSENDELLAMEYGELIELFKNYVRNQGRLLRLT